MLPKFVNICPEMVRTVGEFLPTPKIFALEDTASLTAWTAGKLWHMLYSAEVFKLFHVKNPKTQEIKQSVVTQTVFIINVLVRQRRRRSKTTTIILLQENG